jgi:hypothetical protein
MEDYVILTTPVTNLHIIMILDESGSMSSIQSDIIGSINKFIQEQKEVKVDNNDQTTFTLIKFSTGTKLHMDKVLLKNVPELTNKDYEPTGNTALYDAIGKSIEKNSNDKNVFVAIVTDGQENSSRYYTKNQITTMIDDKVKQNWKFFYLSADLNTAEQGSSIGLMSAASWKTNAATNNVAVGYNQLSSGIAERCSAAVLQVRSRGAMQGQGS